jgi:hypothetical protein
MDSLSGVNTLFFKSFLELLPVHADALAFPFWNASVKIHAVHQPMQSHI